ncbi:MAG: hypothetical protein KAT65_20985 [Methanophagales archaeon]|jgi:hypothetical protein|nr:hypothetical protein [Methanophagales archaeon]
MEAKNIAAVKSIGISSEIKEQYEKTLSFRKRKPVLKEKRGMKKEWLRKKTG